MTNHTKETKNKNILFDKDAYAISFSLILLLFLPFGSLWRISAFIYEKDGILEVVSQHDDDNDDDCIKEGKKANEERKNILNCTEALTHK